jgi:hypothetical protein
MVYSMVANLWDSLRMSEKFFKENPDLEKMPNLVSKAIKEVRAAHPQLSPEDVLKQAKEKVSYALHVKKGVESSKRRGGQRVTVDKRGRSRSLGTRAEAGAARGRPARRVKDATVEAFEDILNAGGYEE